MTAGGGRLRYRAFISYSHQDQAWAQWLHRAIETYRVPSRLAGQTTAARNHPAQARSDLPRPRRAALCDRSGPQGRRSARTLANLIVICSPAAAASRWVNAEVQAFKRLRRADHIFCLVVAGEPNATDLAGRADEECFCPALRFTVDTRGELTHERTEPIAADARPCADGKSNARLKLIAGLIGVGFDALKQREQHRRKPQMGAARGPHRSRACC